MILSIVMPALNEEATICQVIQNIPQQIPQISKIHVIVVDDGSVDKTNELASKEGAIVVRHIYNQGVGKAFQTGVLKSLELGSDIMVNMDSDGQFNPGDIPVLIKPIIDGKGDCATASRFIRKEFHPDDMSVIKFYGNKLMSLLISFLIGRRYYDVSCGFRAYTRHALMNLNLVGEYTYTQEMFLNFAFKGIHIEEVPIKAEGRRKHGESRVANNLFRYAFRTMHIILRAFRDYKPLRVFGLISCFLFLVAICLAAFLLHHYLNTGAITPHKWAGFSAGFFAMMGFVTFTTGLVADMLDRIRINQERILYSLVDLKINKK